MSKIVPVVLSNLEPTAQRDDDASSVSSDLNFDSENSKQKDHSEVTYGDLGSNAHSRFRHELKAKIIQEVMDEVLPDIGAYDIDGSVEKEQVRKGRCIDCLKFLDLWPLTIHETILNGDWKKFEKFAKDIRTDKPPPKYKTCFYKNKFNPLLVNQYDEQGRSPLGLAVRINSFEMVDILITNKAFPDICDEGTGRTPLMYSIINKSLPISKLLIQAGASVNMCDFRCVTPLMLAASLGDIDHVDVLANKLAEVDAQDENGWTPLHYAAHASSYKVCALLLDFGADRHIKDAKRRKAFDIATFMHHGECIHVLEDLKTKLAASLQDEID